MTDPVFNPPPGWPTPPPGWVPPPGWRPPSSWPAPPPGWQLWVSSAAGDVRTAVGEMRRSAPAPADLRTAVGEIRQALRSPAELRPTVEGARERLRPPAELRPDGDPARQALRTAPPTRPDGVVGPARDDPAHAAARHTGHPRTTTGADGDPRPVMPEPFTTGHERRRRRKTTTATPLEQPDYVTRAITYPPSTPGIDGTRSTRHDAALRSARSSGTRLLWLGVALAVAGVVLYATAPDPGQVVLSWGLMAVGAVQLLRGLGRWAKAALSLAALPDPW